MREILHVPALLCLEPRRMGERPEMSVLIPDDILQASRLSERELKVEIAVMLFEKEKLTLGQASHLAAMDYLEFQHLLARRRLPVHYDVADFEQDLKTLGELGRQ
jgi:predicted HTH domain antitoxin